MIPSEQSGEVGTKHPSYYDHSGWDVDSWVEIISVEYESLVAAYPFSEMFSELSERGPARLLDVGCGTGIFPTYLDPILLPGTRIRADLLDVSRSSIDAARQTLAGLQHFEVERAFEARIEEIPSILNSEDLYDAVWAIHSFTTVDVSLMAGVYSRLWEALSEEGVLLVYQLTSESSYQLIHRLYRSQHPDRTPYMDFENSRRILDELGLQYDVHELRFDHVVPANDPETLSKYLQKVVLDDSLARLSFLQPALDAFRDQERGVYVIPQSVNLIEVRK